MTRSRLLFVVVISAMVGAVTTALSLGGRDGRTGPLDPVTGIGKTEGKLITLLDYHESGRRLTRHYLRGQSAPNGGTLWHAARSCAPACVRVEVEVERWGESSGLIHGSGVLVSGGAYALTVGHLLDSDQLLAIRVILTDGRAIGATVAEKIYAAFDPEGSDWAVLKLGEDRPDDLAALQLGDAEQGEPVIALGYPEQIGIDESGRTAYSRDTALAPLLFPAHVSGTDPITLTPSAGAVPLFGMSGGPVVNAAGEVVGIFASVSMSPESDRMVFSYGVTPVAALRDALGDD